MDDPEINGHVRSMDKRIYNITKGLQIFFHRHKAALFQTPTLKLAIWKTKKYFFIFDSNPRRKDIFQDPNGAATLTCLQSIRAVISVLLDRTNIENQPFLLSRLKVLKIMEIDEPEDELITERSEYQILNDKKAVVRASFDLGDKCFSFTRNKQALTMCTVSLVYSRITSPNTWKKTTLDKIMVVGNQLFIECMESEEICNISLDNLPAVFTIGPYVVEVFIYANLHVDTMFKKGRCRIQEVLEIFFEKNTNAIVEIEKYTLAIWHQRGMYYCFDPYARDTEGFKCRHGAACVTMNVDLQTLIETLVVNFDDKDDIFKVHAIKVLKIHRDPTMEKLFPKTMPMNDVPMERFEKCRVRKSKKKAVEKPLKVDFTERATKKLLPGESPEPSLLEVGSNVGSLDRAFLPKLLQKLPPKEIIKTKISELTDVADLDSPTLSETQVKFK